MTDEKADLLQGTLDLLVLKALAGGPLHGLGVSRRIGLITRGAFDADYDCALGDAPDTVLMRGGSLIVSPHGQIVAGPDFSGETILYADIDLDEVTRGKYDFDVVGHYARPDIFRLTVDESKRSAVVRKS